MATIPKGEPQNNGTWDWCYLSPALELPGCGAAETSPGPRMMSSGHQAQFPPSPTELVLRALDEWAAPANLIYLKRPKCNEA